MPISGYNSHSIANASEGFMSTDGVTWYDINTLFPVRTSICLKAYSVGSHIEYDLTDFNVNPNVGTATLTIARSFLTANNAYVSYNTVDGTAMAGTDYIATSGQITFLPTDIMKTITVPILDTQSFKNKKFFVNMSTPINAIIGTNDSATVMIHSSHKPIQIVPAPGDGAGPYLYRRRIRAQSPTRT